MRHSLSSRRSWSERLFNAFGSLGPAALLTDVDRLSDRDRGDIGAAHLSTGERASRALAGLRSRGFGPIF